MNGAVRAERCLAVKQPQAISDADLLAFRDEVLPAEQMADIELALRESAELRERLRKLCDEQDQGWHSVAAIWRAHRISCPQQEELAAYLVRALSGEEADYVEFHIRTVGCRYCEAELRDLQRQQHEEERQRSQRRRRRFFESSLHYVPRRR